MALLPVATAAPSAAEQALLAGDYDHAEKLSKNDASADARALEIQLRALLATGKYREAAELAAQNVRGFRKDAAVLLAIHDALQAVGSVEPAKAALDLAIRTPPGEYDPGQETPAGAAARARALTLLGASPKDVLNRILDAVIAQSPDSREPYLALAEIALDKHDYALAAKTLRKAAKSFPNDADVEFGLARSFADPKAVQPHLDAALKANPRHVPALLFKADRLLDVNDWDAATKSLDAAIAINPASPEAWARRSLLAQLRADPTAAEKAREKALAPWGENPEVDFVIGTGLAHHYRFREAIAALKSALQMDPTHLPSHFELGTNLLRYGNEADGWSHIEQVQASDPYNVAAFNLVTLRDTMGKMETITEPGVRVRMAPGDRIVFGPQAANLAAQACRALSQKYGVALPFDVTVDVLPTQQDFAVRTFSLPGNEGFLGVCFGPLITTCSPRGRLERANWQAVLWHEMAHSVTLTGTRNRMPRWLSEGISVFEENAMSRGWGMGMNSQYRETILKNDKLPKVRDLDAGFRGEDIEFAYFRASMAVDYLDQRVGTAGIRRVLEGLRDDLTITAALEAVVGPLDKFEDDFTSYEHQQAEAYGPQIDWAPLSEADFVSLRVEPEKFLTSHPNRYFAIMTRAHDLTKSQDWAGVIALLEPLVALEPNNREKDSPYALLASACRGSGDSFGERRYLEKQLSLDATALTAARRLLELAAAEKNPASAISAAQRVLAIDPFNSDALLALGRNSLKAGSLVDAISAYEALLSSKPLNAPRLHLELARALFEKNDPRARRQVLLALENNPRLVPALELLQRIHAKNPSGQ